MSDYLVGHIIKEIKIADDKMAVLFITDRENVVARTDGDCCSQSWIENIEITAKLPAEVVSVEDIGLGESDEDDDNCMSYYGLKITTTTGHIIIDYRNASNGYYGGNIAFPGEHFYGGVYGQNESTQKWIDIEGGER